MNQKRKEVRSRLSSITTRSELSEYLETLNISDDDRQMLLYRFGYGYSNTKIAMVMDYNIGTVSKRLNRLYSKLF